MMGLRSGLRLSVEDQPARADVDVLPHRLEQFNESRWPNHQVWQPLAVFAREAQEIIGDLAGYTYAGRLFVQCLWVSDDLRGQELKN